MIRYLIIYALLVITFSELCSCQMKDEQSNKPPKTYSEQYNLEIYKNAKFGLFIHWGLYSIPAGTWKGEEIPWLGEHIMRLAEIPVNEYEKLATQFNPIKFDANEYVDLACKAGMKYLVFTSKHHDGFAMFDSKADSFNIVQRSSFKRDVVGELAKACNDNKMPFGLYYSQAQDWHHPHGVANTWDFPQNKISSDYEAYVNEKSLPQVNEITFNYGPLFLLWFDTPKGLSESQAKKLAMKVKENQPATLVTDRIGFNMGSYAQMGDNAIPTQVKTDRYWETAATLNDTWGYKSYDNNWNDPHDLIFKLTDIVSKGGNYLLNIGPDGSGRIPQESVKILTTIGNWLEINGEAIYGTTHSPFYVDNIKWRCTQKPNSLYFHIFDWGSEIIVQGLKSKVLKAQFLETNEHVDFIQDEDKLYLTLPQVPVNKYNSVIKVEIEDDTAKVYDDFKYTAQKDTITLFAREARYRGEGTYYDWNTQSATNLYANMYWYIHNVKPGTYRAEIEYACEDAVAGSKIIFTTANKYLAKYRVPATDKMIKGTNGEFKIFTLPELEIKENTEMVAFGLEDKVSANAKISKITLVKK